MNNQIIFLLFACDGSKAITSLRCAAISLGQIRRATEREIHERNMKYTSDSTSFAYQTITQQIREFRMDWKTTLKSDSIFDVDKGFDALGYIMDTLILRAAVKSLYRSFLAKH